MLVIVRHGNTFHAGEPPRRIGARTDPALTAEGLAQAQALGQHFAQSGWHFARAHVSPLLRTRQTAQAILAAQPAPPEPEAADFLREIDHGPDENRTEAEILARIGAPALAAWDSKGIAPPGWQVDAAWRITQWQALFAGLAADQPPQLFVTSNGAARFALLAMETALRPDLKLPTGSYGLIVRRADGTPEIAAWGVRP